MKFYQILYKNLAEIGFTPQQQQNNLWPLNAPQMFYIGKYSTDVIVIGVYVFSKAESIDHYMVSTFSLTVIAGITISFISIIFENDKLFHLIEIATDETTLSKCCSVFLL